MNSVNALNIASPSNLPLLVAFVCLLGLLVGSFLNVVILRLPQRLYYHWNKTLWEQQSHDNENQHPFNETEPPSIIAPASHCIECKTPIKPWHNIPVVSFLLLKGQCAYCQHKISIRYPFVELLTAALSAAVIYHFGWSLQGLFGLILTWVLIALCFIDIDHQLLPDNIVLPTLYIGLAISLIPVFAKPINAIIGCIIGYSFFWVVYKIFKLITGKAGMGYGDFKLLALLGAWFGWQMLPQIILISTLLGSIIGIGLIASGKQSRDQAMPFGPFLALAGWLTLIWGEHINNWYLSWVGLS